MTLDCKIRCFSSTDHLSHLYTGFGLLNKKGQLRVTLTKDKYYKPVGKQCLIAEIGGAVRIFYDLKDGSPIYDQFLDECDVYFKRSFDPNHHGGKIKPLGLNYPVTANSDFGINRLVWDLKYQRNPRGVAGVLFNYYVARKRNKLENFENYPEFQKEPTIVFLARLWDPELATDMEIRKERAQINIVRTDCIRALRKEFKKHFVGGVFPDELALRQHKDITISKAMYEKSNYVRLMKASGICIATMGLERSTGWKMAEYIAASKAIVSERLRFETTGDFECGKNYLEFENVSECVERVGELFENPEKRFEMATANFRYYHEHLRPDVLVWNSINTARSVVNEKLL